eukprot:6491625-Amphidinium_carterae.1
MPATRGREKGAGRALRELLEQQGSPDGNTQLLVQAAMLEALEGLAHGRGVKEPETLEDLLFGTLGREEEDVGKMGTVAKGSSNLTRWHTAVERNPEMFIEAFNLQVIKSLGADITGTPWSLQQYASTKINFRRMETHERCFHMMATLHSHWMRGETTLMMARCCQFMKALEQSIQHNGGWRAAWLLTGLPDPRPAPGMFQQGLSHSSELGLTAAYLKELKVLEDVAQKEGESAHSGGAGSAGGGAAGGAGGLGGGSDKGGRKKKGDGKGGATKGTPPGDSSKAS